MPIFIYGDSEIAHLRACDEQMCAAIDRIGPIERAVIPDLFEALCKSIVGQQISTKAQQTIFARFREALCEITPQNMLSRTEAELQSFGISFRKAAYLRSIAEQVASGAFDLAALADMDDEAVTRALVTLDGVGVWTAEMLMIFSMQRKNVLSFGDLAIRRGICMLYDLEGLTKAECNAYRERYAPYASTASLYLWAIAGGAPFK